MKAKQSVPLYDALMVRLLCCEETNLLSNHPILQSWDLIVGKDGDDVPKAEYINYVKGVSGSCYAVLEPSNVRRVMRLCLSYSSV